MSSRRALVVDWARAAAEDFEFTVAREWIGEVPGRRAAV